MIPKKYKNRAQQGAYKKGWLSFLIGLERKSPYDEKRGMICFVRTFVRAWLRGYDDAKNK